ncbi:major facilitator superfamily domain-containing protein [Xylariaceae sp. FL0016]|nr:major facilitator superfamily domain-containing protein [Xylariaceae sp. FL0016]
MVAAKEARLERLAGVLEGDPHASANLEDAEPASEQSLLLRGLGMERVLLLGSLYLALLLPTLSQTIVSTALPSILADINVRSSDIGYTWVGSVYALAQAMALPLFARLAGVPRRKPTLLATLGIFAIGSALCGSAVGIEMLLAGRAIQGIGAGGVAGLVFIGIAEIVKGRGLGRYDELAVATWAVASALGPLLGGMLADHATWRWCFFMNLPVCAVCGILISIFLKTNQPTTTLRSTLRSLDLWGVTTIGVGKVLILLALQWATQGESWRSPHVLVALLCGIGVLVRFFHAEFIASDPVVPLRFFNHRTRMGAFTAAFFHSVAHSGLNYWLPLYFQGVKRQSATDSGISMLPWTLAFALISTGSTPLILAIKRYRGITWAGFVIAVLGCGLLVLLDSSSSDSLISGLLVIAGVGFGPNFSALLLPIQASFDNKGGDKMSAVILSSSAYMFLRSLGSSIGISVSGLVFFEDLASHQLPSLSVFNLTQAIKNPGALSVLEEDANLGVFHLAMQHVFVQVCVVTGAGLLMSLVIAKHKFDEGSSFPASDGRGIGTRIDSWGTDGG